MKTSAALLTEQMTTPEGKDRRDGNPNAIYAIVADGETVHCMTEGMLDAWWTSLKPADKAEIHERWLDADLHEVDATLHLLRDPLNHVYNLASRIAETHRQPFVPDMPTFSPAETAWLNRAPRRQN